MAKEKDVQREKEAKILEIDQNIIVPKLLLIGAKKTFEGLLYAEYFDFDDKYIKNNDAVLRLREEGDKNILTLKTPLEKCCSEKGIKDLNEENVGVSSFKGMRRILEFLGLGVYRRMTKKRITYELNDVKYELDKYAEEYDFIPALLEIEGPDKRTIVACAEKIGFLEKDLKDWNLGQLIKYYSKNK